MKQTVAQLKAEAKALKIPRYSKMGKAELIEAIAAHKEYDPGDNSAKCYSVAIAAMRDKLKGFRREVIGDCTLYLGDCLEVMPHLKRGIDLVLTDPPYSTPVAVSFGRSIERSYGGLSIQRSYVRMLAAEWQRLGARRLLVFCDDDYYPILHEVFYEWPFRQLVVWDKGRIGLGRCFRRQHELLIHAAPDSPEDLNTWAGVQSHASVLRFAPVSDADREHGAQKPVPLMWHLVQAASHEGQTVFDPFMGSGASAIACVRLRRKFVGVEIEPKHFDLACRRIEEAYKQPDFFVPRPAPPVQLTLEAAE